MIHEMRRQAAAQPENHGPATWTQHYAKDHGGDHPRRTRCSSRSSPRRRERERKRIEKEKERETDIERESARAARATGVDRLSGAPLEVGADVGAGLGLHAEAGLRAVLASAT